jgi:hypothetical protein
VVSEKLKNTDKYPSIPTFFDVCIMKMEKHRVYAFSFIPAVFAFWLPGFLLTLPLRILKEND